MDNGDVYYSHSSDDCDDVSSNGQETESPFGGMSYSQNREDDGTLQVDSQNIELTPLIQQDQDIPNIFVHAAESSIDEPRIGLEFKYEEEARRFYNIYAYKTGFSIRKASQYKAKRKNNMVTSHYYVCSKEAITNLEHKCKAIFGQHPKSIITDQDPAMKKAIKQVFPNTVHRCCQWHVMRKAREYLGVLYNNKEGFKKELESCINNSITVEEFETKWSMMLQNFELQDNSHLQVMWNSRESWVPVYFRDAFFAEMSTSQRSESMNALTKIYTDCHTSIYKFVTQIEKMVASRYDKEDEADFRSGDGKPSLWSHNPIEKEAREVYTRRVYSEFKNQLRASTGYEVTELKENLSYKVSIMPDSTLPYQRVQSYTVSINPSKERVECSCKYFEFSGLLCSHALKDMIHLNMRKIPPDYIMKRWTKVAKKGSLSMKLRNIEAGDSLNSKALRFNALSLKVQKIPFEASKNFESYQMACEKIDRLVEEIISLNQALKEKQGDNIADDIGDEQALSMRSSHFVPLAEKISKEGISESDVKEEKLIMRDCRIKVLLVF
ncbi:protein FAR1-RELATED SEQUENCE 5-like [Ananas comosus]|uniref:Protein FAR1-RELATED SEQUENCE n=1 Tax=Ananas comosus TaxID=4615 RepID=A0A6P5GJT1_ANACO|nr:protein FAR1-RELATED SEQUENCE 5-like [Ananas comosus]